MASRELVRILIVEDDEDDYILDARPARRAGPDRLRGRVGREPRAGAAADRATARHDVYLIDYRLGAEHRPRRWSARRSATPTRR